MKKSILAIIFRRFCSLATVSLLFISLTSSSSIAAQETANVVDNPSVVQLSPPATQAAEVPKKLETPNPKDKQVASNSLGKIKSMLGQGNICTEDIKKEPCENFTKPRIVPALGFAFGETVTLQFENDAFLNSLTEKDELAVLIDGQRIFGITPKTVTDGGIRSITFDLMFSPDDIKTWSHLYYKSRRGNIDATIEIGLVNAGSPDSLKKLTEPGKIHFSFITGCRITFFLTTAIILSLIVLVLSSRYGLLKDSASYSVGDKTYSLGRTQFACWSIVMLIGTLWISSVTLSFNNAISGSMLVVLATSIGALGAGQAIDSSKIKSSEAEEGAWVEKISAPLGILRASLGTVQSGLKNPNKVNPYQLEGPSPAEFIDSIKKVTDQIQQIRATAPSTGLPGASNGFIDDISTDVNGLSLQRVQMIATNIAVASYVLLYVFWNIDFPQLSETTLGLVGLSSGAYAGLKMGEKHS